MTTITPGEQSSEIENELVLLSGWIAGKVAKVRSVRCDWIAQKAFPACWNRKENSWLDGVRTYQQQRFPARLGGCKIRDFILMTRCFLLDFNDDLPAMAIVLASGLAGNLIECRPADSTPGIHFENRGEQRYKHLQQILFFGESVVAAASVLGVGNLWSPAPLGLSGYRILIRWVVLKRHLRLTCRVANPLAV